MIRIQGRRLPSMIWSRPADRAALGVTLGAVSRADTAGVTIDAVLKSGAVLTANTGLSLKARDGRRRADHDARTRDRDRPQPGRPVRLFTALDQSELRRSVATLPETSTADATNAHWAALT
jgi:hypothetical protein